MSSLPLVIVNPASASGATSDLWPGIASGLRAHFGPFSCAFTARQGDGRAIAERAAHEGRKLIIACGGDGTINEVANGILASGADAELGVLPSGTGGDFRRTLGMPTEVRAAARALRAGRTRLMDVGRATYADHDGGEETRHFLGVASLGLSPGVIRRVKSDESPLLPKKFLGGLGGQVSFAVATLGATLSLTNKSVAVRVDDGPERHLTVTNFCVANARYFGGGMKIAPDALLNDGQFDVISVGDLNAAQIITNAPKLYLGKHLSIPQVRHARAARVFVRSASKDDAVMIEIDGELPGRLPAAFEVLPRALRVRLPA